MTMNTFSMGFFYGVTSWCNLKEIKIKNIDIMYVKMFIEILSLISIECRARSLWDIMDK